MNSIKKIIKKKPVLIILAILIIGSSYYGYKTFTAKSTSTKYILSSVEKGTLIVSVSGSGQITNLNQIDLKPKVSGNIIKLGVTEGQDIKAGASIAQIDATEALKSVRDAQVNLESAQLSLKKLQQPTDSLSLTQAQNSLDSAKESKINAQADLEKAYDDGYNAIADTFLDLPSIMSGLQDILYSNTLNSMQSNLNYFADSVKTYDESVLQYRDDANNSYGQAQKSYDQNFLDYKVTNRGIDQEALEALITETYNTTNDVADAVKNSNNLIDFYKKKLLEWRNIKPATTVDTYLTSLQSYTSKVNSHLSELISIQNTIKNSKNALVSADRTIKEKTESLADLEAGTDPLDIQSAQLTIQQRLNSLYDARQKLADYSVVAPFDGTIAKVDVEKSDSVTSATTIATLITKQQVAELSLNEVDAAKVKIDQKANLTFDAITDLEMTGKVVDIDTIGTVSSGVVTYTVKIGLDTQDERIKSGMTVSAAIITDIRQDVLLVPNSAVKTQGTSHYVEMLSQTVSDQQASQGVQSATAPTRQTVEIGLSDDTSTEISAGLKEGDQIIIKTVTEATTAKAQTSALSLFGFGGQNKNATNKSSTTTNTNKSSGTTKNSSPTQTAPDGPPPGGF
ncbi:MAG: efflux RND transporter periplasmic adaptor subunit [Patescibacteria group bacterium]